MGTENIKEFTKKTETLSPALHAGRRNGVTIAPPSYGLSFIDSKPMQRKENKTGMPDQLKSGVESLSGIDMSDVKVHYNSSQPAQLNAHAYAQGNQIHIAPGQEKHLPHEAWHVVQQKQGRVKPTMQMKDIVNVNDDKELEKEADLMGSQNLQNTNSHIFVINDNHTQTNQSTIQGNFFSAMIGNPMNKLVGNTASDILTGVGGSIISGVSSVIGTTQNDKPWYGPLTGRGFGTFAEARLTKTQFGGNPSVENETWLALLARRTSGGDSYYIRGHLLNRHLGGPGDDFSNLTPLTQKTNHQHSATVEQTVKAHVAGGDTTDYRVQAVYGRWPWQWPSYLANLLAVPAASLLLGSTAYSILVSLKDAEQHIPVSLKCNWWVKGKHYSVTVPQVPNSDSGFWVRVGSYNHDFSRSSALWDLMEGTAASAIKAYLIPALIPYLTISGAPIKSLQNLLTAMSPTTTYKMLVNAYGGNAKLVSGLSEAGWDLATFIKASKPFVFESLAEVIIRKLSGKLVVPTLGASDPKLANREAFNTLSVMHDDERETLNNIKGDNGAIGSRMGLHQRGVKLNKPKYN